jgi:hypothetical protein
MARLDQVARSGTARCCWQMIDRHALAIVGIHEALRRDDFRAVV